MTKYYDLDRFIFKLERTSSGYFHLEVLDQDYDSPLEYTFPTIEEAYAEILSYSEIDRETYEDFKENR